jgi:Zn-dependent M28 family amino/carboxypeptidase
MVAFGAASCVAFAPKVIAQGSEPTSERSVRAHIEMLASDALQGRSSLSRDSWVAATYLASELRRMGVAPAGDAEGYLQSFPAPPRRSAGAAAPAETAASERRGWNVVGRISGAEPSATSRVIVLGAHLDHIGLSGNGADRINNGADDNASGVATVLGLAEALVTGPRAKRTVYVVFFDGEELGGYGASFLLDHSPVPLDRIATLVCFEMLGRPDLRLAPGTLWLTGYDRSTLGPELARWGATIVADPYPRYQFFERSDNAVFAYRGVVSQTISSFGLHADYHRPSDEVSSIDVPHVTAAIRMLAPHIRRLANSEFEPAWLPGRAPQRPGGSGR